MPAGGCATRERPVLRPPADLLPPDGRPRRCPQWMLWGVVRSEAPAWPHNNTGQGAQGYHDAAVLGGEGREVPFLLPAVLPVLRAYELASPHALHPLIVRLPRAHSRAPAVYLAHCAQLQRDPHAGDIAGVHGVQICSSVAAASSTSARTARSSIWNVRRPHPSAGCPLGLPVCFLPQGAQSRPPAHSRAHQRR